MDFFGKLNAKNTFGMFEQDKSGNLVNIICGVLLLILIIILIICLVRKDDKFSNTKHKHINNNNSDEEHDVHFLHFVNDACKFSNNMTDLLIKNDYKIGGHKVKDVSINSDLAKELGITGTPSIYCTRTKKKSVGFKPLDKVLEELMDEDHDVQHNNKNNHGIHVLVGSDGCPYCRKAYKLLDELNINYKKVQSNSPEGIKLMKDANNGNGARGVPYMKTKDGKEIIGYNEEEFKKL
jgi:glutaredoxin